MKVLHINQSDVIGGAGIAAHRLHTALNRLGAESYILAGLVNQRSDRVDAFPRRIGWLERKIHPFTYYLGFNQAHILGTAGVVNHPFFQKSDILNFHNLHTGYFNYMALPKLTRRKPAVFTLHDMWSFTGHCVYSYDCDRWQTGCGKCPYPKEDYPIIRDNTKLEVRLKKHVYSRSRLGIVAPSRWLAEQAAKSVLKRHPIHCIPHGIDLNVYRPLSSRSRRAALGILEGDYALLFAAGNLESPRKGALLLFRALELLPEAIRKRLWLLCFGSGRLDESLAETEMRVVNLGAIADDIEMVSIYSMADLFVLPTRADNLPLVLLESMACGTPMVAFDVGGVPDLVRPGLTGYLAEAQSAEDLSRGIRTLLEDSELRTEMAHHCREIAVREYADELQASRYLKLYESMLPVQ